VRRRDWYSILPEAAAATMISGLLGFGFIWWSDFSGHFGVIVKMLWLAPYFILIPPYNIGAKLLLSSQIRGCWIPDVRSGARGRRTGQTISRETMQVDDSTSLLTRGGSLPSLTKQLHPTNLYQPILPTLDTLDPFLLVH
jgi:hypothetical protein